MKRLSFLALVAGVLLAAGCSGGSDDDDIDFILRGNFSGSNEIPANTTGGTGTSKITVNNDGSMRVQVNATGLTGEATGAHIHVGMPSTNGSIVTNLLLDGTGTIVNAGGVLTIDRTFPSTPVGLGDGTHYVNVHTNANPGGELRANLSEAEN